ncbi:hypothetical protein CH370_08715 [Leptospira kmetyi]|nr:hypothetical protein CH370_08715 [Leptospira kmetyi]
MRIGFELSTKVESFSILFLQEETEYLKKRIRKPVPKFLRSDRKCLFRVTSGNSAKPEIEAYSFPKAEVANRTFDFDSR